MIKSTTDDTPAIPHMVLSETDAIALEHHFQNSNTKPNYIQHSMYKSTKVTDVVMPEDSATTRSWDVDYVILPQVSTISQVSKLNGRTSVPLDQLISCQFYSWKNTEEG